MAGIAPFPGDHALSLGNLDMAISTLEISIFGHKLLMGEFYSCKGDGNTGQRVTGNTSADSGILFLPPLEVAIKASRFSYQYVLALYDL
jgi:hypothetical protein